MTLHEQIGNDLKTAMKAGDKSRVEVLRFVIAQLNGAQKDKQAKEPGAILTDEEAISVLQKETKKRKEAVALFIQGKRDDLVQKEEADLKIISAYLPQELSRDEIVKIVDGLKAQGSNDFNSLMRESMKAMKGRADGKTVGEVIKERLA